jgi:hypothetical protein
MIAGFDRIRRARDIMLPACAALLVAAPAFAQGLEGRADSLPERRPGTIIGGNPSPAPTLERCVEVEIGSDRALGCLNQKLRREVERVNPSMNLPPLDARSSDVRVGNVNEAAVRQQYGSNYGRSVIPFRPPTPSFVPPRH